MDPDLRVGGAGVSDPGSGSASGAGSLSSGADVGRNVHVYAGVFYLKQVALVDTGSAVPVLKESIFKRLLGPTVFNGPPITQGTLDRSGRRWSSMVGASWCRVK